MSQNSNSSAINIAISALLGLLIAKVVWVVVDSKYLPKVGEEMEKSSGIKKLYYHYNLASKKEKPRAILKSKKPASKPKPKEIEKITKFILKGIYNSKDKKIILVVYGGKSYALYQGEEIQGYKFTKLYPTYAILEKDSKEYKLDLYKKVKGASQPKNNSQKFVSNSNEPKQKSPQSNNSKPQPIKEGDTTIIPKTLFNKYKGDYRAIRRNINAVPNMENGKLNGFKISFVRKGSDFDKLGLKRGDIITAINGEPLDNFKVPLEFFNNADTLTAATLTVKRGNEIKELEYEVR